MKNFIALAAGLAVALSGTMASAQDGYRGPDDRGGYDRGHGGDARPDDRRYDRDDRDTPRYDRDDRRDDRDDRDARRYDRDDRRGYGGDHHDRGRHLGYARGQRYRGDGVFLSDYGRYGYRAPPRGYRYYRTNSGDVVLAAIATGIIASVLASGSRY